jgi:signal transduction histidine kinase
MESELRQAQDELIKTNKALEQRVEERTASLRDAIAQMEEFSYSVSHDLRSPLRAIQGYAKVLTEDHAGQLDAEGREYLGRILQSGSRMERLINDVLTYTRISRKEIQLQPVSLGSVVKSVIEHYPEFSQVGADIRVAGELPPVIGHEPSLSQAISNLLNNAMKFVEPGVKPQVSIRADRGNGLVRLWVEDNGIGVKPEHQHRLFGMFERIHPEGRFEGTGIGLAIVRKVTERMGGKVGVESDGVRGSKFWIQLPAA